MKYQFTNEEDLDEITIQTQPRASNLTSNANDDLISKARQQIKETTDIMQRNIENATERGYDLENTSRRVEDLELGAQQFGISSTKTRNKMWLSYGKWTIILVLVVLGILVLTGLVVFIAVQFNEA